MYEKDPAKVRAGKASAEARWRGMRARVRLDDLTVAQRALVIALVDAMRESAQERTR